MGHRQLEITADGAWCWFGDPRAIHVEEPQPRTFVGYISGAGDITVAAYDHDTGSLTSTVVCSGFEIDDHNNPTLCVRPDGHLLVFWAGHPGDRIWYRRSAAPYDASAWEPEQAITDNTEGGRGFTYQNLVQLSAEPDRLFVFWRGGNYNPTYATTTDASTWSPARPLIEVPGERPYLKVAHDGVDTIHFAFTDGHPNKVHTSIYYLAYRDGWLFRADGSPVGPLGTAIHPSAASVVYDARRGPKSWVHDVSFDADGQPVIVYATFPTDRDHRYRYVRWTGAEWLDTELVAAGDSICPVRPDDAEHRGEGRPEPEYSGGISLDPADSSTVLLSRQEAGGPHEIERWTTRDHGQTWTVEPITRGSSLLNARPVKPRGMRGDGPLSLLWMTGEYPGFRTFKTRIVALVPEEG